MPGIAELLRPAAQVPADTDQRQASGRESHSHKITVYLSSTELLELELREADLARLRHPGRPGADCQRGARGAAR